MASKFFHISPATLQENAAAVVAAHLWQTEVVTNGTLNKTLRNPNSLPEFSIKITTPVQEMVYRFFRRIQNSLIEFMEFHLLRVFHPHVQGYDVLNKYYNLISFKTDCSIDCSITAKNFVKCKELHQILKFSIASQYCFTEEIRSLWPDVKFDPYLQSITLQEEPWLYYWISVMGNRFTSTVTEFHDLIGEKIINSNTIITRPAILYLWTKFDPEKKISLAISILEKSTINMSIKDMLSVFEENEIDKIIERAGILVIRALALSPAHMEYALQMWRFMKNMVVEEDFVYIFDAIAELNPTMAHLSKLLYGIWIEAPEHLKEFAIATHLDEIVEYFYVYEHYPLKNLARDISLLLELLSYKNLESRNLLWRTEWIYLIKGVSATSLNKLMQLCFNEDEEISSFKKANFENYSKIEPYCQELVTQGYFDELDEFLHFCSSNPKVVAGLKKKIIWSEGFVNFLVQYYCYDPMKMQAFHRFSHEICPENRRMNLLTQVVTSSWHKSYLREIIDGNNIHSVVKLIQVFFIRENDQKKVKKNFLQICFSILIEGKFDSFSGQEWDDVLLWCMNGNKIQLDQFKNTIPIDGVFTILFYKWLDTIEDWLSNHPPYDQNNDFRKDDDSNENNRSNAVDRFYVIDDFLSWVFVTKMNIDKFKMDKIKEYKEAPLSEVLESNNDRLIKLVLRWFFNGDSKRIDTFKKALQLSRSKSKA